MKIKDKLLPVDVLEKIKNPDPIEGEDILIENEKGELLNIKQPINITEEERKKIFSYLWRIETNRDLKITIYTGLEEQITVLKEQAESIFDSMD